MVLAGIPGAETMDVHAPQLSQRFTRTRQAECCTGISAYHNADVSELIPGNTTTLRDGKSTTANGIVTRQYDFTSSVHSSVQTTHSPVPREMTHTDTIN